MDPKIFSLAERLEASMRKAQKQVLDELLPQDVIDAEYGSARRSRHQGAEFADRLERRTIYDLPDGRQAIEASARSTLAAVRESRSLRPGLQSEIALALTRALSEPDSPARARQLDALDTRARQALKNT
ncbi:MAG TPA: hypothetical protein PJ986_04145 [Gammaproteobacteria bacterium]|nr:hypothetical protein [Gammaproteobacteria bacterium]